MLDFSKPSFYQSLSNCPNRCQWVSKAQCKKSAKFQVADSICQFLCPGTPVVLYWIRGNCWHIIIIFLANRHSMYTGQDGYGVVPEWCTHCQCRYRQHTFMCHKFHVKHTKQFNIDCVKSGLKSDTNANWRTLFGEGRRGVQPRLFCILCQGVVLMEWFEWMWRVALSLAATEARPSGTCLIGSL